ncbi:MAG: methyltransferase domain-containing protein [Verrucomicrobiota bacterium]|nr:methyltransferase domain-containing protein [Verrucomicrobiota bacterium]
MSANVRERWLRMYVHQKLRSDPIFAVASTLLVDSAEPVLDVGCGVGLLGFYLRERGYLPSVIGVDRDGRKIARAREIAASGSYDKVEFRDENICATAPTFSGNVALFDVLHYLPRPQQRRLLLELAKCVAPGGVLLIRDAPRDARPRFWLTFLAEIFAQTIAWNVGARLHFPARDELRAPFPASEFTSESRPLWGNTPFNNHLFIFRRCSSGAAQAAG